MKWLIGIFLFLVMLSLGVLVQERLPKETMENIAGSYILTTITVVFLGVSMGGRIIEKIFKKGGE